MKKWYAYLYHSGKLQINFNNFGGICVNLNKFLENLVKFIPKLCFSITNNVLKNVFWILILEKSYGHLKFENLRKLYFTSLCEFLSKILNWNLHFRQFLRKPNRYPHLFVFFHHGQTLGLFVNKECLSLQQPRFVCKQRMLQFTA